MGWSLGVWESWCYRKSIFEIVENNISMKQSTPNFMVYGETGTYPISIDICTRMITF